MVGRAVTPDFRAAPQIRPADLAVAAAEGCVLVINNRPDGEEPGQPTGAQIEAAARAAGLAYVAVPVRGMPPSPEQAAVVGAAMAEADGPVLAYCRSGTRSVACWAMAVTAAGDLEPDEARALARAAGWDLSYLPL